MHRVKSSLFAAICALSLFALSACDDDTAKSDPGADVNDTQETTDIHQEIPPQDIPENDTTPPEDQIDLQDTQDLQPEDLGPDTVDVGEDVADTETLQDTTPDQEELDLVEAELPPPPCGHSDEMCCPDDWCQPGLSCVLDICHGEPTQCPLAEECIVPPAGQPDVPIVIMPGKPAGLLGGAIEDRVYTLERIEVYPDQAFIAGMVTHLEAYSNGNSFGSLEFRGGAWAFSASIDLTVVIHSIASDPIGLAGVQNLYAAGCFSVDGNELLSDMTQCNAQWPAGITPPTSVLYQVDTNAFVVDMPDFRDIMIATMPDDYKPLAELIMNGPLYLLLHFEPVD